MSRTVVIAAASGVGVALLLTQLLLIKYVLAPDRFLENSSGGLGADIQNFDDFRPPKEGESRRNSIRQGLSRSLESGIEIGQLASSVGVNEWIRRDVELRRLMGAYPQLAIPEMSMLSDEAWLRVALEAELNDEAGIRRAMAEVRSVAKAEACRRLSSALRKYLAANNGSLPITIEELVPLMIEPLDPKILMRYRVTRSGSVRELERMTTLVIQEEAIIDPEYDIRAGVDANGIRVGGGVRQGGRVN